MTLKTDNRLWLRAQAAATARGSLSEVLDQLVTDARTSGRTTYDLTAIQVFAADEARINGDPFDALICAAAIDLELPLITHDADIRGSGVVKVIW